MNITHDGKTYEVLTLGKHRDMTHALFAGGSLEEAETCNDPGRGFWVYDDDPDGRSYSIEKAKLHNIQPLRLVPREPVTFEASVVVGTFHGDDVTMLLAPKMPLGKRFRCVEIVEEQA
jgi:hypothetical protein